MISAAFIVGSSLVVAGLQYLGASNALLFALLGLGHIGVTYLVLRAWGREGVRDFGGFLFKALFRVEVRGRENIPDARRAHDLHAQPRQPARRPAAARGAAGRRRLRRRHRHRESLVGEAVHGDDHAPSRSIRPRRSRPNIWSRSSSRARRW